MTEERMNCWEVEACGLEPEGKNVSTRGICPVAVEERADGIHQGINGGRCCWSITGTLCRGEIQGSYTKKIAACLRCDFYKTVKQEEQYKFQAFSSIRYKMKQYSPNS
jgi:methyl-accepting chemotaxis protein